MAVILRQASIPENSLINLPEARAKSLGNVRHVDLSGQRPSANKSKKSSARIRHWSPPPQNY
jgi:hypothetical protein